MNSRLTEIRASAEYAEEALVADIQATLQDLLDHKGLSRADLARRMGVSKSRVTQIFSSEQNFTVRLLARAFHAVGEVACLRSNHAVDWETKGMTSDIDISGVITHDHLEVKHRKTWDPSDFGYQEDMWKKGSVHEAVSGPLSRFNDILADAGLVEMPDFHAAANDWSGSNVVKMRKTGAR